MNTELLLKVKAAILAEPLKFDMETFFEDSEDSPCGTTACIAGHAIAIYQQSKSLRFGLRHEDWETIGQEALDLTPPQRNRLFYAECWPAEFYDRTDTNDRSEYAQIAADRIDHFIATEGRE